MNPPVITTEGVISLGEDVLKLYPIGRSSSEGGVLVSSSCVAHFLEGDEEETGLSRPHFLQRVGSLTGEVAACGSSIVWLRSSLSSMMISAISSGLTSGTGESCWLVSDWKVHI